MTIEPNERLTVVLTAEQWGVVLHMLHDHPVRTALPLIQAIQRQCMQQDTAASDAGDALRRMGMAARGNGEAPAAP